MSRSLVSNICNFLNRLESLLPQLLFRRGPPYPALALANAEMSSQLPSSTYENNTLKELLGDGMLWAVPKHRRTIEKRLNMKFGYPEYNWKPLKVKSNLRSCNQCGHDHEVGVLCPHCYNKIREETQLMQSKIEEQLGLRAVDKEVIVLYEGEQSDHTKEFLNGKRVVEMEKPRPMWFTKNLIQKTTQQPADTKEVKPSDLG